MEDFVGYAVTEDGRAYKSEGTVGNYYLDGQMELLNGYDQVLISHHPQKDGIYPITIYLANGNTYKCNWYFWYPRREDGKITPFGKGLIVLPYDNTANEIAFEKMNNKEYHI